MLSETEVIQGKGYGEAFDLTDYNIVVSLEAASCFSNISLGSAS